MLYGCMLYDCMMYPLIRGVSYVIVEYSVWNENVGGGFHAAVKLQCISNLLLDHRSPSIKYCSRTRRVNTPLASVP
jgi:hypothetical protein